MRINNLGNSFLNRRNINAIKTTNAGNNDIISKNVIKYAKYNESELNILSYKKALKHDQRNYLQTALW